MNNKSSLLLLLGGLFLVLFLTAASPTEINNNGQHCYALSNSEESNGSSRVIKAECFDNFGDSIYAATNGRVQLNSSTQPEAVTDEALNSSNGVSSSSSQVVIGIDWDSTNLQVVLIPG